MPPKKHPVHRARQWQLAVVQPSGLRSATRPVALPEPVDHRDLIAALACRQYSGPATKAAAASAVNAASPALSVTATRN